MSDEFKIELEEGESEQDALLRLAASLNIKPEKPSKGKPKEKKVTVTDPSSGSPVDETIYMAVHIYQRPGEPDGAVRSNATQERKMYGPGTLVFQHLHSFGATCTPACREKVLD